MNPMGIRLAIGSATVSLGALGAFQIFREKPVDSAGSWPDSNAVVAHEQPPAPLALTGEGTAPWSIPAPPEGGPLTSGDGGVVRANNESAPPAWGASAEIGAPRILGQRSTSQVSEPGATIPSSAPQPVAAAMPADPAIAPDPAMTFDSAALAPSSFELPTLPAESSPPSLPPPALLDPLPLASIPDDRAAAENPLEMPQFGATTPGEVVPAAVVLDEPAAAPAEFNDSPALPPFAPANELVAPQSTTLRPLESGIESQPSSSPARANQDLKLGSGATEIRSSQENLSSLHPSPSASPAQGLQNKSGVASLQTVDSSEILSQPGTRNLEGSQAPSVVIHKRAPAEIRVGKGAEFILSVRNVGSIPALDVRVFDKVPLGATLLETVPPCEMLSDLLVWQLGDLQPGEERSLIVKLVPNVEGELGSVARVTFEAAASVRTVATQPGLKLVQHAPQQVLIGQQIEIDLELVNQGSGAAENVILKAELPEGLEHVHGKNIELPIGAMPPGDQRKQILRLRATRPGVLTNTISIVDAEGAIQSSAVEIEVVSPNVQLTLEGPSRRYLERQATYQMQIGNAGTADATNLEIVAFLDKGLKFVSTEAAGQYDPGRHAVYWSLEELPAGQAGSVPLTLLPVEAGSQDVRLEVHGDLGIAAASAKELTIETLAELNFSIADDQDPIEIGSIATYLIRVQNTGTRDDTNVRLEIQLPHPALEFIGAEPISKTDGMGRIVFEPIARIPAKGEQTFRIQVRGAVPDTHLIKASLLSDQSRKPVTKEESTTVYSDR